MDSDEELLQPQKKQRTLLHRELYLALLPAAQEGAQYAVGAACVAAGCGVVAAGTLTGDVLVYECARGRLGLLRRFALAPGTAVAGVSVSPQSRYLLAHTADAVAAYDLMIYEQIWRRSLAGVCAACWVSESAAALAVDTRILVADVADDDCESELCASLHKQPIRGMSCRSGGALAVSWDAGGMIEYWSPATLRLPPSGVRFRFKAETDLFYYRKRNIAVRELAWHPDGTGFAVLAADDTIARFKFATGKIVARIDESACAVLEMSRLGTGGARSGEPNDSANQQLAAKLQRGMRLAGLCYDPSGHFLMYASALGVRVLNIATSACAHTFAQRDPPLEALAVVLPSSASLDGRDAHVSAVGLAGGTLYLYANSAATAE